MPTRSSSTTTTDNNTNGALADAQLIPHSLALQKLLLKPSKLLLCEIVIDWLNNRQYGAPHPPPEGLEGGEGEDEMAQMSIEELKELYEKMKTASSVTRKAVVERIVERDWNRGLNLWQIGHFECRCVVDNAIVHKWTAGRLFIKGSNELETSLPKFHTSSFIYNLQGIIKPMIKSHCSTLNYSELSLVIIRIQLHEPAGNAQTYTELPPPKRIIFCAFPENAPFIIWNTGLKDPLRAILLDSLAPAMSRPGQRFELRSTALTAKSLTTMVHMRASSRAAHALGAWSLYADNKVDKSPLDSGLGGLNRAKRNEEVIDDTTDLDETGLARMKRRKIAEGRFGTSGIETDGKGIEKLEVTIKDKMPELREGNEEREPFRPVVTVRFEGTHVFAGIRSMVEDGIIDGVAMPGWMTGEDGVNVAVVKDRKVWKRADRSWY